jgi:3-dehydroquinate synthase
MNRHVITVYPTTGQAYDVTIGGGLLARSGRWARAALGRDARQVSIVSNPTVFELYGYSVQKSLRTAGFKVSNFLMKDGERFKTLRTAEQILRSFSEHGLTRADAVVALGGGVVGDVASFAASTFLRGVPVLQMPTTLLAMADSSVGGKTGVNTAFGKNLVGTFHQPSGVLIDTEVLRTLPSREFASGLCEMIKLASIAGPALLSATCELLSGSSPAVPIGDDLADLIAENVRFKASIVAGDARESPHNRRPSSRKILNFGHTFAHALEKVTEYKRFRHGEAVGHGILFAGELSKSLALCREKDVDLLYDVVHRVGTLPTLAGIDEQKVLEALSFDKKMTADGLEMVLLRGIGRPVIFTDIPPSTLRRVLKNFLRDRA